MGVEVPRGVGGRGVVGTIRVFDPEIRKLASQRLRTIAENVAIALGAAAGSVLRAEHVVEIDPVMSVEDFTFFTQAKPGAYFFVGAKIDDDSSVYPHHPENFDFNEHAMLVTAKVFAVIYFEAPKMAMDSILVDLDSI